MAVTSDVIFRLGTVGTKKAAADFGIAAAAIAAVGLGLKKTLGEAVEFSQQWGNLTLEQRKGAAAMDAATKSLADTQVTFKAATKLTEAGMKPIPKLMESIGKLATDMSQKLGEGPKSAQARIERLTDAIAKGQTRALKEYGIDLENTEDLLLAQGEAMDKVIDRAENLTIEYQTMEERLFALNNNIDTSIGLSIDWFGSLGPVSSALDGINDHLGVMNKAMMDSNGAVMDLVFSFDFLILKVAELATAMVGPVATFFGVDTTKAEKALKLAERKLTIDTLSSKLIEKMVEDAKKPTVAAPKTTKKVGAGGRRKGAGEEMIFTEEEAFSSAFAADLAAAMEGERISVAPDLSAPIAAGLLGGIAGTGVEPGLDIYDAQLEGLTAIQKELDAIINSNEDRWLREQQIEQEQMALEQQRTLFLQEQYAMRNDIVLSETERMLGIEQEAVNASNRMWQSGLQSRMQMMQGFFGNLALLQHTRSKAMFKIGQVAAIAEAGIQGALGAVKAYQSMAGIPYVGPVLGAAAAGAVIAYTAAQIRQIRAQKFGGGSAPSAGVPAPSLAGGSTSFGEGEFGQGGQTIENTIILDGQVIHESVMNTNDSAQQQGRRSFGVIN
jgi:hypothetical protein